jgi:hypothetical protein
MAKKYILLIILVLAGSQSWSQFKTGNVYFRGNFGVNFGIAGADIGLNTKNVQNNFSQELLHGSFGNGINLGVSGGYLITDIISLEGGYQFVRGTQKKFSGYQVDTYELYSDAYLTADYFRLGGALFQKLRYLDQFLTVKFGFILPASRNLVVESNAHGSNAPDDSYTTEQTEIHTLRFNPGIYSAVGALMPVDKDLSVFAEVEFILLSGRFSSSEVTRYEWVHTHDGNSEIRELYNLSISERYTTYQEEITGEDNIITNPGYDINEATVELTQYVSMNSLTINIGIIYNLRWKDLIRKK